MRYTDNETTYIDTYQVSLLVRIIIHIHYNFTYFSPCVIPAIQNFGSCIFFLGIAAKDRPERLNSAKNSPFEKTRNLIFFG